MLKWNSKLTSSKFSFLEKGETMKKICFLILCLILPGKVYASTVNYDFDSFYVDADILENGDMHVEELIVLDGTFHGYVRDLVYENSRLQRHDPVDLSQDAIYNATNIKDIKIKAKKIELDEVSFDLLDDTDYTELTRNYYKEEAKNGDYVESSIQSGKSLQMFYEADNEVVAFVVEYTLQDVVVLHNDIAEIYWTFLGSGFEETINDVQIRVRLPQEDTEDHFRIWAHGDITGNIDFLDNQTLLASIKRVSPGTEIDIRATFNKDFVSDISLSKQSGIDAFDKIIDVEEERARVANEQRRQARFVRQVIEIICYIYIVLLIIWWIYVYIRFDKEYKSNFKEEYYREFIEDYNVEVVDYLMNNTITPNAMSASILNLIYKKNIKVEEIPSKKKKKEYEFTLINRENVNDTEDVLLDFLFDNVGKEGKFTTKELENYAKSPKTMNTFEASYNNWLRCVKKDAERQNFFEKNGLPIISAIFFLLIALFIILATLYFNVDTWMSLVVMSISIVFLIYSFLIKKRTKKGQEDYVRWLAFKHFLEDFGRFDIKELPEIALWERYLVYATVFGLADKVEEAMNVKINEIPEDVYMVYPIWLDYHIAHTIHHAVNSSIMENRTSVANSRIANSSNSSGSGFGGGFGSGGGFGGGGGGGHGF